MPENPDGSLRPFTADEIEAMGIQAYGVRPPNPPHGQETREIGQSTLTRSFLVNWASRFDFCALVCGDQKLWDDGGYTKLSRMLPDDLYGRHPDKPEIVATKILTMHGARGPGLYEDERTVVEYPSAQVDVLYTHAPFDLKTDEEVEDGGGSEFQRYTYFGDSQGSVQNINLPSGAMRFWRGPGEGTADPHGRQVPYGISVSRAEESFSYNWVQLPYEAFKPTSHLYERVYGTVEGDLPYLGCINSTVVFNRPVGTVMFTGVTPTLERSHTGVGRRWSLKYDFAFCAFGWNWLYFGNPQDPSQNGWFNVNTTGYQEADVLTDGRSLAPGARDLNDLFKVSA